MPTSGTTVWSLTAREVVLQAFNELAVTPINEAPAAAEMDYGLFQLNAMLKSPQFAVGIETTGTVTIPAASSSGALAVYVQEVISARYSGTFERQLVRWERDEYLSLPNKAAVGEPTAFYVSNQRDATVMYVWPVPAAETTLKIDYRRKPDTITDANETVDFPEEYHGSLIANLAVRIAGRFGAPVSQELALRAERLRREMEDAERPASYMLGAY
jgi:hypothetical protein